MDLARPGDPLVTREGQILEPEGRKEPDYSLEVPIAKQIRPKISRSVREMGTDGQTQTVVNAVLVYKLLGVSKMEIAHILGTSPDQIDRIESLSAFQETFEMMFRELLSAQSNSIQARIASFAGRALNNMMDLADAKPIQITRKDDDDNTYVEDKFFVPPIVILKANENILDRSGLSADNLFGKAAKSETPQLEIEITTAGDNRTDLKVKMKG